MGDKYAGPVEEFAKRRPAEEFAMPDDIKRKRKPSYMETDAENQNNALAGGAQNIMDPNWNKMKYKKEAIRDFVPKEKAQSTKLSKVNIRKSYPE